MFNLIVNRWRYRRIANYADGVKTKQVTIARASTDPRRQCAVWFGNHLTTTHRTDDNTMPILRRNKTRYSFRYIK